MSLDVYLSGQTIETLCICPTCGHQHMRKGKEFYSRNITHNLGRMAGEAGIYKHLWRPDEIDIKTAAQLIAPLSEGLALLKSDPDRFRLFNPPNGWGNYEGLVNFVEEYLQACKDNLDANVSVSR